MKLLKNGFEVLGLVFMNNDFFKSFTEKINQKKRLCQRDCRKYKKNFGRVGKMKNMLGKT